MFLRTTEISCREETRSPTRRNSKARLPATENSRTVTFLVFDSDRNVEQPAIDV